MPKRKYNFPLPYDIPGYKLQWGLAQYKDDPIWQKIPANLRAALEQGEATGGTVRVQAKDLDRLPEPVWQSVRAKLGLS